MNCSTATVESNLELQIFLLFLVNTSFFFFFLSSFWLICIFTITSFLLFSWNESQKLQQIKCLEMEATKIKTLDNNRWGFDSWHCRWKWTVERISLANTTKSDHIFEMCVCVHEWNHKIIIVMYPFGCRVCFLSFIKMQNGREIFFRWKKKCFVSYAKMEKVSIELLWSKKSPFCNGIHIQFTRCTHKICAFFPSIYK